MLTTERRFSSSSPGEHILTTRATPFLPCLPGTSNPFIGRTSPSHALTSSAGVTSDAGDRLRLRFRVPEALTSLHSSEVVEKRTLANGSPLPPLRGGRLGSDVGACGDGFGERFRRLGLEMKMFWGSWACETRTVCGYETSSHETGMIS